MNTPIRQRGFTLIELLVAMTLGLLLLAGIVTLVVQTSRSSVTQQSLGRMQENGRFALAKIVSDIRLAGAQYCTSYENIMPVSGQSRHRPLTILADQNTMPWGIPTRDEVIAAYAAWLPATQPYPLSTRYFMQGHECTTDANCQPLLNIVGAARPVPPAAGVADGSRARAADVLTVRYLATDGVPIGADRSMSQLEPAPPITLDARYSPAAASPPLNFAAGDLALITNCNAAQVFEATASANTLRPSDTNDAGAIRNRIDTFVTAGDDAGGNFTGGDSRVFNFTKDFRTVTYYLALRTDRDDAAGTRRVSTLMRQVNGVTQPLTDGVERLEFRYGVEDRTGAIRFLTAQEVNNFPTVDCPPYPADLKSQEPGCMWRSVRMIDVSLLLNSVTSDAPSARERYSFTFDNQIEVEAPATLPSGLPRERMFRREFRTTVMLRNAGI